MSRVQPFKGCVWRTLSRFPFSRPPGLLFKVVLLLVFTFSRPAPSPAVVDFMDIEAVSMAIKAIYLEGRDSFYLPPGNDGRLSAKTYPINLSERVRWAVVAQNGDISIELDAETGLLMVAATSGTGWITVQASAEGCQSKTKRIEIGCECSGQDGACDAAAGTGSVSNGSVDVRLSLGRGAQGRSAGRLLLYAEKPLAILSTPEALVVDSAGDEVRPAYRDGRLMQILTPQVIVNFLRFSPAKYEVHFYDIGYRGQLTEDGLYSLDPRAVPMTVWRIENPDAAGESVDALAITEFRNGETREFYYRYEAAEHGWTLISCSGLKIESKAETIDVNGDRVVRTEIAGPDGTPVRVKETAYREFVFGEKPIREYIDPQGAALVTRYRYRTSPGPGYGKLIARIDPDGGWVRYGYDEEGRIIQEVRPFLDASFEELEAATVVVATSYAPVDPSDRGLKQDRHRPRQVIEYVQGIETARRYHAYIREKDGGWTEISERCTRQGKPYGDHSNLRTVARYYGRNPGSPSSGKIKTRLTQGGSLATYTYERGRFLLAPDPTKCRFLPGKGKALRTTVTHGTRDHPQGILFQTTRETTISDAVGREKFRETFVRTEEGFASVDWQFTTHDRQGRVIEILVSNGTRTESTWGCCGKTSETNAEGITTRFVYDDLKRLISTVDEAGGVVTDYTYDAADQRLSTTRHAGEMQLSRTSRYDGAGRLVLQADPAGLVTRFAYTGNRVTTIRPGGATETASHFLDGRLKSMAGTAVVPRFYCYGVNRDGSRWTTVHLGKPDSPRWEKTTRDVAGRTVKVERPGYTGIEVTRKTYDGRGRLIRVESTGRAATLYTHDALGNRTMTGLDVDGDGQLRPASMDRIIATQKTFKRIDGAWWHEEERSVFPQEDNIQETIISTRRQRMTGWENGVVAEQVAIDIHGGETRAVMTLDRFNQTRIRTVHTPDSIVPAKTVYVAKRLAAVTDKTGITRTFGYDALGRRIAVEDPRKGMSRLHYDDLGRLTLVEDASGSRARFAYDPETGLRIAEYNALNKAAYYSYNARGQLVRTWGEVPYPVAYDYDGYGQMTQMRTFRGGRGWNEQTWPKDTGVGDKTSWHYQDSTGFLLAKQDAKGNKTTYTYGPGGELATRTWARLKDGKPLSTSYEYDAATGELLRIDYSDDTPDVDYSYNRMGRKIRVSDALGVRHFTYGESQRLASEELDGEHVYRIDRSYDDLGRTVGFTLEDSYAVSYEYDAQGRFRSVVWRTGEETGRTVYRYLDRSHLLAGMESQNGLSVDYVYERHRDVKTAVTNQSEDRLISRYKYEYDVLGRRINALNSGEAFDDGDFWLYGYNDRNEVTSASRFLGNDLKDQTRPQPDWERAYRYDPIGNRIAAVEGTEEIHYRTNALNQYEAISHAQQGDENLSYDQDGNLIEDGRFRYRWNAENRLIAVEPKAVVPGARRLEFAYDFLGRRFAKKVLIFDSYRFVPFETIHFVYDGWNMIKEIKTTEAGSIDRFHVWGLDLSQSIQGVGGVGGLLATSNGNSTHAYLFDANGNVGQLVDYRETEIKRSYEYEAYGRTLTTNFGNSEIYRFGSKAFDKETDCLYYGYRYFSPRTGRWIKKDPIAEKGGKNLYSYANNNGLNFNDILGLLLYAFDGTGNDSVRDYQEGEYTNVYILYRSYPDEVFFAPGPGSTFGAVIYGGATGAGTGNRINDAYEHFKEHYKPEMDSSGKIKATIDIIGFSRGAAIAREFANILANPEHSRFKGYKGCPVPIRFVGLFDTVDMTAFVDLNLKLPDLVEHAAQAVASDEKRDAFPLSVIDDTSPSFDQKYFTGDHSDIGRGHGNYTNFLSLAPLFYIYHQGISAGVPFEHLPEDLYENFSDSITPHDLSEDVWYWRFLGKQDRGYTGAINGTY